MSCGILSQSHKNLTQFCNIISGGNCDILQVSALFIHFNEIEKEPNMYIEKYF